MLDYIYRLMRDFEKEHGFCPNLLHLNQQHCAYLQSSFDPDLTLHKIMHILGMEVMIDQEAIHPYTSWSHCVSRAAC